MSDPVRPLGQWQDQARIQEWVQTGEDGPAAPRQPHLYPSCLDPKTGASRRMKGEALARGSSWWSCQQLLWGRGSSLPSTSFLHSAEYIECLLCAFLLQFILRDIQQGLTLCPPSYTARKSSWYLRGKTARTPKENISLEDRPPNPTVCVIDANQIGHKYKINHEKYTQGNKGR